MIKKFFIALFMLCLYYNTEAQTSFSWDLDQYHDYSTFVTLQYRSNGINLGDDMGTGYARNLSNSSISLTLEFIITDFCGNSKTQYWPGGLDLKPGQSLSFPFAIPISCKELRKDGAKSTGIASVTCQVLSFKNLTEEANKLKEEKERKDREWEEQRLKKEREMAEKKKAEEEKAAETKAKVERERKEKEEAARNALAEREAQKVRDEQRAKEEQAGKEKDNENIEEEEKKAAEKKVAEKKAAEKKAAEKEQPTKEEQEAKFERNVQASKLEVDGDELRNSNPSAAKQKYEEAQLINYTNRVEEKIKSLKTNLQVEAGFQAIQGIDKLADELDPNGKTRFYELFSGYDGFAGNNDKLNKLYASKPWQLHAFGFRMSAIFLAAELRMGFFNSPYYQFEVRNNKDIDRNIDNVGIQHQSMSIGLSGGLNIPLKNFCIYGLYGAEWVGGVIAKNIQEGKGYNFNDDDYSPKFPDIIFVLSAGIDFRIPKTRLGIGARYNLNKVQIKPRDANVKLTGGADTRYQYFMNRISPEKVEYSNVGLRLIWNWDN